MKEKNRILELLKNQEISIDEAKKRLEELNSQTTSTSHKRLKIDVHSSEGDIVKVSVPLGIARLLTGRNPRFATKSLAIHPDIDLEAILAQLEQGDTDELVNIESADGDRVNIRIE